VPARYRERTLATAAGLSSHETRDNNTFAAMEATPWPLC
jgi:hypothetical protein